MPPRFFGLRRKPVPHLPDWNIRLGLIRTELVLPRSASLLHQLPCQSAGTNASSRARVADSRITALFSKTGVPSPLAAHPLPGGMAFPELMNSLPVESSTTTPPAAQNPEPDPEVT